MRRRTWLIIGVVVVLIAAGIGVPIYRNRNASPTVTTEVIRTRDLDAIVSASGKIQPKRQINISATTMGRVTRLAVQEGQRVKAGQFLLEIDPRSLAGQLERGEASVAAARSALQQADTAVDQAHANLELAQQTLKRQQDLSKDGLTTREALERAQNDVTVREAELKTRQQEAQMREQQIKQEQAALSTTQYNLSQVTISSPMNGIVTRRNIEEGENVVVGTMNNAGTVLLTVADMSSIQAEVEVDETDIPTVTIGQPAIVTIDAVPDRMFKGHVTDIGNSPVQAAAQVTSNLGQGQATNFKVVVAIDDPGAHLSHRRRAVGMERLDRLQPPRLALLALFLGPDDRLPVGRENEAGAGVGDLDAVAAGLVDVEEERLLDRVLVRAGLDVDAVFEKDIGGA